jgi:hypothetical protein
MQGEMNIDAFLDPTPEPGRLRSRPVVIRTHILVSLWMSDMMVSIDKQPGLKPHGSAPMLQTNWKKF